MILLRGVCGMYGLTYSLSLPRVGPQTTYTKSMLNSYLSKCLEFLELFNPLGAVFEEVEYVYQQVIHFERKGLHPILDTQVAEVAYAANAENPRILLKESG